MDLGARTAPLLHFWEMLTHRCSHPSGFSLAAPLRRLPPPGYTHVVQADDNLMWQSLSSSCVWICNKCLLCTRHYVGLCTFNLPTHFYLLTIFFGRCPLQPIPSPGLSPSPLTQPATGLLEIFLHHWRPCHVPQAEEKNFRPPTPKASPSLTSRHCGIVISLENTCCPFFQQGSTAH